MTKESKCVAIFVDFCKAFDSINWTQMEAILLAYQIPQELVSAIMSIYNGAKAGLLNTEGKLEEDNTFKLNVGVLQGDTLAPYLFIIVMDFVLKSSMEDELGICLSAKSGTTRTRIKAKYLTDLAFADDIVLLAPSISNAQKLLSSLERKALKVGLKINQKKTEYILYGSWDINKTHRSIKVKEGRLNRVEDYKYLGSWILNSKKDFLIRKELAWKAARSLFRVWKSNTITRAVKIELFLATVESVLLYNATTWTMNDTLNRALDGCYTKLLRYALNISWRDHIPNTEVYRNLSKVSVRLRERRLIFAGHCWRSVQSAYQPIHDLLFWSVPNGDAKSGAFKTYIHILLNDWNGDRILKRDHREAILDIKSAMEDRKYWRENVKKICKRMIPLPK